MSTARDKLVRSSSRFAWALATGTTLGVLGCGSGGDASGESPLQPGIDPEFGTSGIVRTAHGVFATAHAVALQPDGKIVIAGKRRATHAVSYEILVARYLDDGTLDAGFGTGGIVTVDIGPYEDEANAIALQTDGRIVVAGTSYFASDPQHTFLLARFDASGALDPSFGTGGVVSSEFCKPSGSLHGLALQSDGKIVAAGTCSYDLTLARFESNGTPDVSFGVDGIVTVNPAPSAYFDEVAIQPDGKIVAAGSALLRFDASGAPDPSFGGGSGVQSFEVAARGLGLADGGRLVTVTSALGNGSDFEIARFEPDATPDSSFGNSGIALVDIESSADQPHGLVVLPDGRVVAVGVAESFPGASTLGDWAVLRLTASGLPDTAFGNDGTVITRPTGDSSAARAVTVQPDGRAIVVGHADSGETREIALVRYLP